LLRSVVDESVCAVEQLPYVRYYNECLTQDALRQLYVTKVCQQPHQVLAAARRHKTGELVLAEKPLMHYAYGTLTRPPALVKALYALMHSHPRAVLYYIARTGYGQQHQKLRTPKEEQELQQTFKKTLAECDTIYKRRTDSETHCMLFWIYRALLDTPHFIHDRENTTGLSDCFCLVLSRITHSCESNCILSYRRVSDQFVLKATRVIEPGERLTMDFRLHKGNQVPLGLYYTAGVYCCCVCCVQLYQEEQQKTERKAKKMVEEQEAKSFLGSLMSSSFSEEDDSDSFIYGSSDEDESDREPV
jgi:hypothetical protein